MGGHALTLPELLEHSCDLAAERTQQTITLHLNCLSLSLSVSKKLRAMLPQIARRIMWIIF